MGAELTPNQSCDSSGSELAGSLPGVAAEAAFRRYQRRVDEVIEFSRPALFAVGRVATQLHSSQPFTSLVIEERAGRFAGLFMAHLLGFESGERVFGIKPDRKSERDQDLYQQGVAAVLAHGGVNPLVITEVAVSGDTGGVLCDSLRRGGISPVYATLFFDSRQQHLIADNILNGENSPSPSVFKLSIYAPAGCPTLPVFDPSRESRRLLLLGMGITQFQVTLVEHEALNSLPLPIERQSFVSGSLRNYWLGQSTDADDAQARRFAIEYAQQQLDVLVREFRGLHSPTSSDIEGS